MHFPFSLQAACGKVGLRTRIVIGLVVAGVLAGAEAGAQHRWCGGHRIEWVGGAPGSGLSRAPSAERLPGSATSGAGSGGGYDSTHYDGADPTLEEPPGLNRDVWEALVFDAQENPGRNSPWGVPLGQRQTLVMHADIVPTVRICIQSPETSNTGKRLAAHADASWWERQFRDQTGLNWNGEIRIAACTGEPPDGWIFVREGRPGEVGNAYAVAGSRREFHPHGGGRWLSSELVWELGLRAGP